MTHATALGAADHVLCLPDGRRLGYAEYGAVAGKPVLFFHGAPGSRRSLFADMAEAAALRNLRLIAPERPGYGLSDPVNGRSVLDWTSDVLALTNALDIDRFKLIGFSIGSLYALACAHALPAQVERIAIVGGIAPMSVAGITTGMAASGRALFDLARADPRALREMMAPLGSSAAVLLATMAASAPTADQSLLASRNLEFETDFAEALQSGIEGIASDFVLAAGDWTFPLAEIQAKVDLWIGAEDCNMPPAMTRHLASALPYSQEFGLPGAGHLCLYTHWHEILDQLT